MAGYNICGIRFYTCAYSESLRTSIDPARKGPETGLELVLPVTINILSYLNDSYSCYLLAN